MKAVDSLAGNKAERKLLEKAGYQTRSNQESLCRAGTACPQQTNHPTALLHLQQQNNMLAFLFPFRSFCETAFRWVLRLVLMFSSVETNVKLGWCALNGPVRLPLSEGYAQSSFIFNIQGAKAFRSHAAHIRSTTVVPHEEVVPETMKGMIVWAVKASVRVSEQEARACSPTSHCVRRRVAEATIWTPFPFPLRMTRSDQICIGSNGKRSDLLSLQSEKEPYL